MQGPGRKRLGRILAEVWSDKFLYFLAVPGLAYFLLFHYGPMYGIVIAFKNYSIFRGIAASPWVGLANFEKLFGLYGFKRALANTVIISLLKVVFGFPAPIVLALLINEVRSLRFKRTVQTVAFLPHFISWVIVAGMMYALLSPTTGLIRAAANLLGYKGEIINLMASKQHFRALLVISDIWHGAGFGAVLYIATIATIDPQLYEAAMIDGASRVRQIWHITLPGIRTTIVILLILRMGNILNAGFDQIFNLANPLVNEVADIIDTYLYYIGLVEAKYSLSTAAGLFKSAVALGFIFATNYVARKVDPESGLL